MECERCKNADAKAIIRGKDVCRKCYHKLKMDNKERFNSGIDIPTDFSLLKGEENEDEDTEEM